MNNSLQVAEIISKPYLLYIGANGHKTYGIKVRSVSLSKEECYNSGLRYEWTINDFNILNGDERFAISLGITKDELQSIKDEIRSLQSLI